MLKELTISSTTAKAGENTECSISYQFPSIEDGDYVKAFSWNGLGAMMPLAEAEI